MPETIREKKEWLKRNAHFDEREFCFFETRFVPIDDQHACLDRAIAYYSKASGVSV